jgi:uncharacterized protein DUF6885
MASLLWLVDRRNCTTFTARGQFGDRLRPTVASTTVTIVPSFEGLDALHERELPQKDNLCGAFWASLVLRAAGFDTVAGEEIDQDLVAVRAGTLLPAGEDPADSVPPGEESRADYRLSIPLADDPAVTGTSAVPLARAIRDLSGGDLEVIPVAGPWNAGAVLELVETMSAPGRAAAMIANLRTGRLWGSRPAPESVLSYLAGRPVESERPDWDVGHFVTLAGALRGPVGSLILVRDTYASLGWRGYHLQPAEAVAAALERGDGREGGVLCVLPARDAATLSLTLEESGFELRGWDNGTPDPGVTATP